MKQMQKLHLSDTIPDVLNKNIDMLVYSYNTKRNFEMCYENLHQNIKACIKSNTINKDTAEQLLNYYIYDIHEEYYF